MESRAYKTKRGATLFVRQTIGGKWMVHSMAKSGAVKVVDTNKALPTCETFEPAQEALDAYALQKELEATLHPDAEPEAPLCTCGHTHVTGHDGDEDLGCETCGCQKWHDAAEEAHEKALSYTVSSIKSLLSEREAQIRLANESLAKLWEDRFSVLERKKSAMARFNAELEEIEAKVRDLFEAKGHLENGDPIPQGLPFEHGSAAPAATEDPKPEEPELTQENTDSPETGDTPAEPKAAEGKSSGFRPHLTPDGQCFGCGHDAQAHLSDEGAWRPCVVSGCGCKAKEVDHETA